MKTYRIICTIGVLLVFWSAFSTMEVVCKNLNPEPEYSSINLWHILFAEDEPKAESSRYVAYGHYYTSLKFDGDEFAGLITDDGHIWEYTIDDQIPHNNMPVQVVFDDNATPDDITDDTILSLIYA